jgi:hypothetical protein
MASNEKSVMKIDPGDRRLAVFQVSDAHVRDRVYFTALREQMDNGGLDAMLFDLLRRDVSNWNVEDIPETKARIEQKAASLPPLADFLYKIAQSGEVPAPRPYKNEERTIRRQWRMIGSTEIVERVFEHYKVMLDSREINALLVGKKDKDGNVIPGSGMELVRQRKETIWGFALPRVKEFRQKLATALKLELPFDEIEDDADFTGVDFDVPSAPF